MIYPSTFEDKIGFSKIRQLLIELCIGIPGKKEAEAICFYNNPERIKQCQNEIDEMKSIVLLNAGLTISDYFDFSKSLSKARIEGAYLESYELAELKQSFFQVHNMLHFFNKCRPEEYPFLTSYAKAIAFPNSLFERLNQIIDKNGEISDSASVELSQIRGDLRRKHQSVSHKLSQILRFVQSSGWASSDLSITLVNGRAVIPIDSSYKRKVKGLVHSESATGKTSYVEPADVVELNNDIRELEFAENREILRILLSFTNDLRPCIPDLLNALSFLGKMDFILAKAKYSISSKSIAPSISNNVTLNLAKARHPLLQLSIGEKVVPLDLRQDDSNRIIVISGPNAGGKSVCLKTVGLIQYMFQCGLQVPVGGGTELGIFKNIFIDIGDEQSIENDLSTYSSHLLNMKNFLKYADSETLFLIDEFGAGTEPTLGSAIAESVLEKLNQAGAFGIVTTHYSSLKNMAATTPGLSNAAMLYDNNKMKPLFILETGRPGSSFAFEIARNIGLPEEIIKVAIEKAGKETFLYDKFIKEAYRDKKYWENKRQKVKQNEKKLEVVLNQSQSELEKLLEEKNKIIKNAKEEALRIIENSNKTIENTIRQIKEANAEKEKTKQIRDQLTIQIAELRQVNPEDERILKKIEKIKNKDNQKLQQNTQEIKKTEPPAPAHQHHELKVGDKVKIIDKEIAGEVTLIVKNKIVVSFGNISTNTTREKLEKISEKQFKEYIKTPENKSIQSNYNNKLLAFSHTLDLRGKRADEALSLTSEFIDNAVMLSISEVRILHGKGNGILRNIIRDFLKTVNDVESFDSENVQFGGDGITVVRLR